MKKSVIVLIIIIVILLLVGTLGYNFVKDIKNCRYNPNECPAFIKKLFEFT